MFEYTEGLLLNDYLNNLDKQEYFDELHEAYQEKERIYLELEDIVYRFHSEAKEVPLKTLKAYKLARREYLEAKEIIFGSDE